MINISFILANPNKINQEDTIIKNGIDIMLALDISESMLAEDFKPNRLTVAKQVLTQFIKTIQTDRVWLVVFAGQPFTSIPLTFDYTIFNDMLSDIDTSMINQQVRWLNGTAIGDAMLTSINLLWKDKEKKGDEPDKIDDEREQIIILLTDGEANQWLDPLIVAKLSKDNNIKIYTVGIGSLEWWFIPSQFGAQQVWWVDEATLKQIAQITNARYWRATDEKTFQMIFDEMSTLQKKEIEVKQTKTYEQVYEPFVVAMTILMLALLAHQTRWKKIY